VRETKRLLNAALHAGIANLLDSAIATETQSFDEPAFRANLARMLDKS
jgi:enoyl-CoA hydratase